MDSKLQKLLEQISLDKERYPYFENGKLDKIVGNKDKTEYTFFIAVEKTLPVEVFEEFIACLKDGFSGYETIAIFRPIEIDESKIQEYYSYLMGRYSNKCPAISALVDSDVEIKNETLIIPVNNMAEENKICVVEKDIIEDFRSFGYDIERVNPLIKDDPFSFIDEETEVVVPQERLERIDVVEEAAPKRKFTPKPIETEDHPQVILGRLIDTEPVRLDSVTTANAVSLEAEVFGIDIRETRTELVIMTLKITDYTDSIYAKIFINDKETRERLEENIKVGKWYKFRGNVKEDKYANEEALSLHDINICEHVEEKTIDDAPVKRVELHAHTMMSQMDGVVDAKALCKVARKWGHRAIAITDHNCCQAFPDVFKFVKGEMKETPEGEEPFKAIYGAEVLMIDDSVTIVTRPSAAPLLATTYVVFDTETTGLNAGGSDQIIEIGAVKICNGEIIDTFDELIDPGKKLSAKITEITKITDDMLKGKRSEEEVVKSFMDWVGELPMVAHNAKFDIAFMEMAFKKYRLGTFKNTVIDTLELSRTLDNTFARHSLSVLVKRYDIEFDEEGHHRADYDSKATALVLHKMLKKLADRNFETISDIDNLVDKGEIHKYGRGHHINILALSRDGLKNLFKIISHANTTYLYKTPRILRSKIEELRSGLLIGSGCYESEVFREASNKDDEELTNIINFYDYVEVQPPEVYDHLLQTTDFASKEELLSLIEKIVRVTKDAGKMIVATGDVHHLTRENRMYREIIVNQKVPGGGRHPLAKTAITRIPEQHLRTTREMLENFAFLGEDLAYEIVVENTNKIADMIDMVEVIIDTKGVPFSPKIENSAETVTELVYKKSAEWYGDPLPKNIEERIAKELYGDGIISSVSAYLKDLYPGEQMDELLHEKMHEIILKGFDWVKYIVRENIKKTTSDDMNDKELDKAVAKSIGGIIGGNFDVIYLISQKLVKKSNDDGYIVGSRGSVGSSLVATMMGITEVNPLPAHYRCLNCQHSIFEDDGGKVLGADYSCGVDMPDKDCPKCGEKLFKDGHDMPFAVFLGFNADKVPDIDLNFSDLNQANSHEYTKELFGVDNVYRAGTIGTVADKTAFGFVKGYLEDHNLVMRSAEIERRAMGCTGVKRTTGQHPGGIIVVPDYMEIFDFTPYQFPADDINSAWRTTHFDYHAIDECLLKLDILGHSDPTQLRMLQDLSGLDVTKIPLDDKETMGIFLSPKPLGVTTDEIMCETGTLGVPEFGTQFTIGMLVDTKPTTFAELVKISGLSHGTDVWLGNAQELIKNKVVPFKNVIGCRDDIMVYLMYNGVEPIKAFKIMEFVRKGLASKVKDAWAEFAELLREAKIPEWYIESCRKIKYMFPKSHAAAYVMSAFRIAWFKVHMPVYYYSTYFSSRITDYDIETMVKGKKAIKDKIIEIQNKGYDATNKEISVMDTLRIALEAVCRGMVFKAVDLDKSQATTFVPEGDNILYPSFSSIDGLGDTVAKNIIEEREKSTFLSIEDVQKRAKISGTLIDKMKSMGIFDGMEESNQISLF